jgi:phage major head subunit gpT-like protein
MLLPSNQESETYKWLGMSPAMREWVGGRNAKGFRENGLTIINKHFEATLEVLVQDLKRDKTGQTLIRIAEMADRVNSHWAILLSTLITNGASALCYDGQYFFDTDHSEGDSGSQSNSISVDISALASQVHGSTTAPSPEEMSMSIYQAISQILSFKDDQGEPMNEGARSFLVQVPVSLLSAANAAVMNDTFASGSTNTLRKSGFSIAVETNPRLTWTTQFAVYRTDGRVKPFIRQEEEPVTLKAIAEGSELEFKEAKHQYGVDCWRNVGYGYWQHAVLVTMT